MRPKVSSILVSRQCFLQFVRHTSIDNLQDYLLYRNIHLRPATSKDAIIKLFDDIPSQVRDLITSEAERIKQMTDELGQSALLECVSDVRGFKAAGSDYDRTVWAFLHEADNFKKAEAIHHADYNRHGRMWSGLVLLVRMLCVLTV